MYEFDFIRPETISDAVTVLQDDEDAQALGGGQTLIPVLKQRLAQPSKLVSLAQINEMTGINSVDGALVIGGASTHAAVATGAGGYPALAALAGHIGDPAVRNRGTLGGSLANNDPAACYPAAVLASGATVVTNAREIAADAYFDGLFGTTLEDGEIITAVRFPVPEAANYQKFVQPASRFALVGVYVAKFADGVRVAVTGAGDDGVFRWNEAEEALTKEFRPDAIMGLSINPMNMIEDLHGTRAYRAHLIGVLTKRAVAAALG